MLPAVVILEFDPYVEIAGRLLRWETITLGIVGVVALVAAGLLAGWSNRNAAGRSGLQTRRDDMLYLAVGALPGAVIGGRLLHALDYFDFYFTVDDPGALLDPARGSLSLLGAVIGGTLTAGYVGWLIGAPLRRWMDVAIVPLLLAIGLGKLANLLGGAGQGAPTDGQWALAFAGGGPWRSVGADLPAHASQVYEGAWALGGILLVGFFLIPFVWRHMPAMIRAPGGDAAATGPDGGAPPDGGGSGGTRDGDTRDGDTRDGGAALGGLRPGLLFGLGLAWWALGRLVVGFTWRDEPVLAGLNMEQVAAIVLLAVLLLAFVAALWPRRESVYY